MVDATSGWLTLNMPLDRERVDYYELQVLAVDGGHPALNSTANVRVRVLDANDEPPVFVFADNSQQQRYKLQVSEAAQPGAVVGALHVQDADLAPNNSTRLFIVDGDRNGVFICVAFTFHLFHVFW